MRETPRKDNEPHHHDPVGSPGHTHPVGTGVGALGGAAAGAAAGTAVAGPVGTAVGAAIGAVAGGLAGRGIAHAMDPVQEADYWRENHRNQEYYTADRDYDFYEPAYRAGYEGRVKYDGRAFDEIEDDLAADYARFRGNDMTWEEARPACRAAWDRVDRRVQNFTRN
ncbi:MAG TPA: hypothetical protein VFK48_12510 [Usitatibacter sp.]|nr:hypothetical protein [Usitatibacter sp.]